MLTDSFCSQTRDLTSYDMGRRVVILLLPGYFADFVEHAEYQVGLKNQWMLYKFYCHRNVVGKQFGFMNACWC